MIWITSFLCDESQSFSTFAITKKVANTIKMKQLEKTNCEACRFKSCAAEVLDSNELQIMAQNCSGVVFKRHERIFREGRPHSGIAYVKSGLVKLHKTGPSHEQILKIIRPPQYIGIPTVLAGKVNQYSVTALETTHICFISSDTFRRLILLNGRFGNEIINTLCQDELEYFHRSINQAQKQIHGRVAGALLFLAEHIFDNDTFNMPLNRTDLGDFVHARRESVTRTLINFRNDNLIAVSGHTITITDKEKLKTISKLG